MNREKYLEGMVAYAISRGDINNKFFIKAFNEFQHPCITFTGPTSPGFVPIPGVGSQGEIQQVRDTVFDTISTIEMRRDYNFGVDDIAKKNAEDTINLKSGIIR